MRRRRPPAMFGAADSPLWSGTPAEAIDEPYTPTETTRADQFILPGWNTDALAAVSVSIKGRGYQVLTPRIVRLMGHQPDQEARR